MVNVYTITLLISDNIKYSYTSLGALYKAHGQEIGVTKGTLYNRLAAEPIYMNKNVTIEKYPAFSSVDVDNKKQQPHYKFHKNM